MDELVERVSQALTAEYPGAPNGRVRDLPDRRAIRWYTTTGLVDRPLGMRGRTALYGPRHLLQLVALKRRQAEGRTLAEIQLELSCAPDDALTVVARVPAELLSTDGSAPDPPTAPPRTRFWADTWTAVDRTEPPKPDFGTAPPAPNRKHHRTTSPAPIGGVALPGGAILVLPNTPTADDRAAIAAAAEPLLTLLEARGLLNERHESSSREPGLLTAQPLDDGRTS